MTHLDRMNSIAEDIGDAVAIVTRALERAHAEIEEEAARAAGQQDLPAPIGAPAPAVGPVAHRLIDALGTIEEAIESNRRQAALDACGDLRMLLEGLTR